MKTLTIKELTDRVGNGLTPRMVRHYHQLGLLPQPVRSNANYRLYTQEDVQRLQRIVALKQQGFQLSHIRKLLQADPYTEQPNALLTQLQRQYRAVIQQISQLRQTATALEGLLGRDQNCQIVQAEALGQLQQLQVETHAGLGGLEHLWQGLDAQVHAHPEQFQESLQRLLPDLSGRSEIEVHLLTQLVLACGDVSLVPFVRISRGAIGISREMLACGCPIIVDLPMVAHALDQTRLAHLNCSVQTLMDNPHITDVSEAEVAFWQEHIWKEQIANIPADSILVIGYAPSVLLSVCEQIQQQLIRPALVIGMPIGFSHAPAAKRQLIHSGVPYITVAGTLGGGLLAATVLNALVESLITKPNCHCYLEESYLEENNRCRI